MKLSSILNFGTWILWYGLLLLSGTLYAQQQTTNTTIMKDTITTTTTVPQDADTIWKKLAHFGGTEKFVPELIEKVVVQGQGVGAIRTIHLHGGGIITEELTTLDETQQHLSFRIVSTPMPVEQYEGVMTVVSKNDRECTVTFVSQYEVSSSQQTEMHTIIKGFQQTFLSNLHL